MKEDTLLFKGPPKKHAKTGKFFPYNVRNRVPWGPIDIEDLHKLAKRKKFCPYYLSKMRAEKADIVLMPYNYLIDE